MYHSRDQASMRLSGCIVRLNGDWVLVTGVGSSDNNIPLMYTVPVGNGPLDGDEIGTATLLNKGCGLDARSVRLGYIRTKHGWRYTYRVPQRRWKQGIHPDNLRTSCGKGIRPYFNGKGMLDCLQGKYPTFEEVLEVGGAFNPQFALIEGVLCYRGTEVGRLGTQSELKLNDRYSYLKEQLEKVLT